MIGALFECNTKYELLKSLLDDYLQNVKYSNNVNIIVDLKSILKKAYRTDVNNIISDQKIAIEDITSSVINTIAHYRNFLYKEGKYSTFYIFYSSKECDILKQISPDYKKHYYEKYLNNKNEFLNLNNIVKTVIRSLQTICKYIPHVFYIDTSKFDEFVYANYAINGICNKNDLNIILSRDFTFYQLLDYHTIALNLSGDNTKLINSKNVLSYITEQEVTLSGNLLNILLSISGYSDLSIPKIDRIGYKKAFKIVNGLVNDKKLVDTFYMYFPDKEMISNQIISDNIEQIKTNFKLIFPLEFYFQHELEIKSDFNIFKPKVNISNFEDLNNRIFLCFPINISFLLKGEDIEE